MQWEQLNIHRSINKVSSIIQQFSVLLIITDVYNSFGYHLYDIIYHGVGIFIFLLELWSFIRSHRLEWGIRERNYNLPFINLVCILSITNQYKIITFGRSQKATISRSSRTIFWAWPNEYVLVVVMVKVGWRGEGGR